MNYSRSDPTGTFQVFPDPTIQIIPEPILKILSSDQVKHVSSEHNRASGKTFMAFFMDV
jgi:hypothetical protein